MTFRSILCPVDFSPQSRTALQYAAALARRFDASLTVLFVNDPLLLAATRVAYRNTRRFVERTNTELERFVKQATRTGQAEPGRVDLVASAGHPAGEILRLTKRLRADLVVMGSHGLSGIQKVFFGSTTEQVLRKVNVPVLAIPPSPRARTKSAIALNVVRVIAPIDLAGEWQPDAIRAANAAAELDAHLLLVHVLAPIQAPPWLRTSRREREHRRIHMAKTALERVRADLFVGLRSLTTAVLVGDAAHEIGRLAHRSGSLVVMSLRGTAGVWGLKRGAVAYHVLTHSAAPVLALPRRRLGGRFSVRLRNAIGDVLAARDRMEIAGIDALLLDGAARSRGRTTTGP
jgi:nucleotide-binding universal stress UspA family protein